MDRTIKAFILRALLAAKGEPMTDDALRTAIRTAFAPTAITSGDLKQFIAECEEAGWIAGTKDDLLGVVWALTPKGKIKAQSL